MGLGGEWQPTMGCGRPMGSGMIGCVLSVRGEVFRTSELEMRGRTTGIAVDSGMDGVTDGVTRGVPAGGMTDGARLRLGSGGLMISAIALYRNNCALLSNMYRRVVMSVVRKLMICSRTNDTAAPSVGERGEC